MTTYLTKTLQALALTVAGTIGTLGAYTSTAHATPTPAEPTPAPTETFYIEQAVKTATDERITRMHINGKKIQASHTEGTTLTDKVASKQPLHLGLLEGTLALYGERTAKTQGVGFDLIGKIGTTATVGATYENNGEQVVDVRGGVDNTFTAQAGIARQADATQYHALFGLDPVKNMRTSASTVLDEEGKGKLNYGASALHTIGNQPVGWWMFGTQDQHGNGWTDVLIALDPTFGYKAGHFPLTLDDKGLADVSRVDNIADFRAPFNSARGSLVARVRDNHGTTGSKHSVEIDYTRTRGNTALTLGTALGWKNSDTNNGTLTANVGINNNGWNLYNVTDLTKGKHPEHTLWFWKEWRF